MSWEYKVIRISDTDKVEIVLDDYGRFGWETINVNEIPPGGVRAYMKRSTGMNL